MALIHCNYTSEVLGLGRSMDVILPHDLPPRKAAGRKAPVLWLLHGLSDDHTAWQRRTSIERYASERGLAVVMPSVDRGFYTDMAAGPRWWTHVSEELPRLVAAMFPVSARREETFVAGLSMGGYGAFKLALRQPRRFAAAASLSGALDARLRTAERREGRDPAEMQRIFGKGARGFDPANDLFGLAKRLKPAACPRLFQGCGTEDFLYGENLRFRDHAQALKLPLTYEEGPGEHEWGYWDRMIRRVLDWLPLPKTQS
jgi:S-formylglutathione hydrolase FrmB